MSFRLRVSLLTSLAVAVAIVGTSIVVYVVDRHQMLDQVDQELVQSASLPKVTGFVALKRGAVGGIAAKKLLAAQARNFVIPGSLKVVRVSVGPPPPDVQVSPKPDPTGFATERIKGLPMRILSYQAAGKQVSLGTSLAEIQANLRHLRYLLILVSLGGIGAAALLGAVVAGRAVAPLQRLSDTAERIVATGDLSERIDATSSDEIGRLSAQLDRLFASLETSLASQRRLVADASHELRTPLATLRANVELLADPGMLDATERDALVHDAREELEAMTSLVEELVELARGEEPEIAPVEFRLDQVVQGAVDRTAKRAPNVQFHAELEASKVTGVPERIERAVTNLLDNARKWSPRDGTVEVRVANGIVDVRDHGPGIADGDLPLLFNRFYRAPAARTMPGAGLGLAIVKQIAEAHGGTVTAANADGGGAVFRLDLSRVLNGPSESF
jgi:two-component system, OmpR family, sensor histidine kinase MprB